MGKKKTKSTDMRDTSTLFENDKQEFDRLEEFVNLIEEDLRDCPEMFEKLVRDAKKPLYDECNKLTRLSSILKLYN